MQTVIQKHDNQYTIISNDVFDTGLSFAAIGLLSYVLSNRKSDKISIASIVEVSEETGRPLSKHQAASILRELKDKGFIRMIRELGGVRYDVADYQAYLDGKEPKRTRRNAVLIEEITPCFEVSGSEVEADCLPVVQETLPAIVPPKKSKATAEKDELQHYCRETWAAYCDAYQRAYGVQPIRNARISSMVKSFVKAVGYEYAAKLAAYYVTHPNSWYVQKGHDFGCLLSNAQAIYNDYNRGTLTTNAGARRAEKTAANFASVNTLSNVNYDDYSLDKLFGIEP